MVFRQRESLFRNIVSCIEEEAMEFNYCIFRLPLSLSQFQVIFMSFVFIQVNCLERYCWPGGWGGGLGYFLGGYVIFWVGMCCPGL